MNSDEDEGMLSRWSRRKRGLTEEEQSPVVVAADEQARIDEEREAMLVANRQAAEEIDLDTIDAESDLSIFLKEGVPEVLKRKALSVLWRSNPVFANVDGLCDYDDDFGDKSLNMKVFKSAWQAGRGYLKQVAEETKIADAPDAANITSGTVAETNTEQEAIVEELDGEAVEPAVEDDNKTVADHETEEEVAKEPQSAAKIPLRQRLALDS